MSTHTHTHRQTDGDANKQTRTHGVHTVRSFLTLIDDNNNNNTHTCTHTHTHAQAKTKTKICGESRVQCSLTATINSEGRKGGGFFVDLLLVYASDASDVTNNRLPVDVGCWLLAVG